MPVIGVCVSSTTSCDNNLAALSQSSLFKALMVSMKIVMAES